MFHFYPFVNNDKKEMQQDSHLIEVKTGHKWLIQRKNTILGNAHYFIKRTQSGYDPAYIMLSEKGVRMRFCFPAE
jgi:hypothetical protein